MTLSRHRENLVASPQREESHEIEIERKEEGKEEEEEEEE